MYAVTIHDGTAGQAGTVAWSPQPDPTPAPDDLLVEVQAAGICRGDLMQRDGLYPPPPGTTPPDRPGLELAGVVAAAGGACRRFSPGDRVMAVVTGAGQSELVALPEILALPVPDGVSWEQAGGFPENYTTAHDALFSQCGLRMGERVCIHGAAGGVGTAAVELATAAGAQVVATVRNPELRDGVAALGATNPVRPGTAVDSGAAVGATVIAPEDAADAGPFDVILELVGAVNMKTNLSTLATGGRIAVIGVGAGFKAEVNLLALMGSRGRIHGSTLRPRPLEDKAAAARQVERQVLPLLARGDLTVPTAGTFPFADVEAAYARFEAGGKLGKLVLTR